MTDLRIALLSSSTIELLQKPLVAALEERHLHSSIWIGGFGLYRQEILTPTSNLYRHDPSIIILNLDGADLFQELLENPFDLSSVSRRELAVRCAGDLASLLDTLAIQLPETTVLLNTVTIDSLNTLIGLEYNSGFGFQDVVNSYNAELAKLVDRLSNLVIVDVASLAARIGFENWRDSRMWYLARSRWSRKALYALADLYASAISGRLGRIQKCVVVDLDNTLWGGIVGEDGFERLLLGEEGIGRAYVEFQLELLNLYRKGVLLAICSKNNSDDALAVIRHHTAMRLREEHFAAVRINWEDKASNLRSLAEELNIGLDSLVFLDDNPAEREWVRQATPEVFVPDWPEDPGEYRTALLELSVRHFYKLAITAEDRQRGAVYQAQAERRKLATSATSLEEFYRSLQMRLRIGTADSFTIPRISQLTQKTNQFNLTTRRYTEAAVRALSHDPKYSIWWLDLTDRFGPSGIVGVLIMKQESADTWIIDTFLLSCRVMGRTVEDAFLAAVGRELGAVRLIGEYLPTEKNGPVRGLYPRLGFRLLRQNSDGQLWELDLTNAPLPLQGWLEIQLIPVGAVAGPRVLDSHDDLEMQRSPVR
jgi:FkbH-like protein